MNKNSLANLIGQYMSDSENDEEQQLDAKNRKGFTNGKIPITNWTECIDRATGHPYYWNVETKEVTWEKPEEYQEYLEQLSTLNIDIPNNSWVKGYSDNSSKPYYVNEYTRVVSWEKPPDLKEVEIKRVSATVSNRPKQTKRWKKPTPFDNPPSDDEKIELITSYSVPSESSSEEESSKRKEKEDKPAQLKAPKRTLVAAYSDGSDSEQEYEIKKRTENVTNVNNEIKKSTSIFPILNTGNTENGNAKEITPKPGVQRSSFASIITGGNTDTKIDEEIDKLKKELEKELPEFDTEKDDTTLPVSTSFDEKTFQRKRRIEFKTGVDRGTELQQPQQQQIEVQSAEPILDNDKKKMYGNFHRAHVEFIKSADDDVSKSSMPGDDEKSEDSTTNLIIKKEINNLSDLISAKVKFLSVGHQVVSAVQAMNIQIETLLSAYNASALDSKYFFKWLKVTSDDLMTLEQNAVPDGWECTWDRKNSQYRYKNLSSGHVQWEFPKDDVEEDGKKSDDIQTEDDIRGEDEMDISTTPPPNENEQIKIENEIPQWDATNPPPPPIISAPTPPPPADINCELASFYSDIANIEAISEPATELEKDSSTPSSPSSSLQLIEFKPKKRAVDDSAIKKKKKKMKVQGLGLKMKEVSSMVANWQKAQKELDN